MKRAKLTQWEEDCLHWMGMILTGEYKHYCPDWDDLPIDETCGEFGGCTCYADDPKAMEIVRDKQKEMDVLLWDAEMWDDDVDPDYDNDDGVPWGWDDDQ